jgi:hypothetical protein
MVPSWSPCRPAVFFHSLFYSLSRRTGNTSIQFTFTHLHQPLSSLSGEYLAETFPRPEFSILPGKPLKSYCDLIDVVTESLSLRLSTSQYIPLDTGLSMEKTPICGGFVPLLMLLF